MTPKQNGFTVKEMLIDIAERNKDDHNQMFELLGRKADKKMVYWITGIITLVISIIAALNGKF